MQPIKIGMATMSLPNAPQSFRLLSIFRIFVLIFQLTGGSHLLSSARLSSDP